MVSFFAANNGDRPESWTRALSAARFEYRVSPGFSVKVGRGIAWINPGLMLRQLVTRPDYIMFGGMWESLTSLWCISFAPAKRRIGWAELNVDIPGSRSPFISMIKRWCFSRCDFIAVPGAKGLAYLRQFGSDSDVGKAVLLPNIVDESVFARSIDEAERSRAEQLLGFSDFHSGDIRLIWPARLISDKGIVEFLSKIDPKDLVGLQIRIVGDGPLRSDVVRLIDERRLSTHIKLLDGYVDFELMPTLYQVCDAFFLPSLHDPNPLSIIEAMHSGLPLLVSERLGNRLEAVEDFNNGVAFDPTDISAVVASFRWIVSLDPETRRAAGARSRKLAQSRWNSELCIERFVDLILGQMG